MSQAGQPLVNLSILLSLPLHRLRDVLLHQHGVQWKGFSERLAEFDHSVCSRKGHHAERGEEIVAGSRFLRVFQIREESADGIDRDA